MAGTADHPITIEPTAGRVVVTLGERTIADSTNALTLREASYPPVYYIPRADVDMTMLNKSPATTRCPYKGDAIYFSLHSGDAVARDAAWSYEKPFPDARSISGYLAFNAKEVEFVENNTP